MKLFIVLIIHLTLMIFSKELYSQNQQKREIRFVITINGDTTKLPEETFGKFHNEKDTFIVPINNQILTVYDSMNLDYKYLKIISDTLVYKLHVGEENQIFENIFNIYEPSSNCEINYFTDYDLAVKYYPNSCYEKKKFKSLIKWYCEFYYCDIVTYTQK